MPHWRAHQILLVAALVSSTVALQPLHAQATGGPDPVAPADPPVRFRLVVASFDEQGVPAGMGDVVADMIIRAIDVPHIEMLERRQVKRVLDEQSFATSDLTEPGEAVRYGRLVDSRYVLVGTVYRLDGTYIVSARIVDTASGIIQEGGRAVERFRTVDEMALRVPLLVRALGLCQGCPMPEGSPPAPAATNPQSEADTPKAGNGERPEGRGSADTTVQDMLERVTSDRRDRIRVSLPNPSRRLSVGDELALHVDSERDGYLSLFVVDAAGATSMLLPNRVAGCLPISAGRRVTVPEDAGFRMRIQPPLGTTRIKAVVTDRPMPLVGHAEVGGLLRRVQLSDVVSGSDGDGTSAHLGRWSSTELEFLVAPDRGAGNPQAEGASRATPVSAIPAADAAQAIASAFANVQREDMPEMARDLQILRWPLASPFDADADIGWHPPSSVIVAQAPLIAVIDADFDPDDPSLSRAFSRLDPASRDQLRAEIRRNGQAPSRHGNRVASLIAGQAPWLPSVLPGASVLPIRVTSKTEGPDYRVQRGDAKEVVRALRRALDSGCRVINLSLSISGDPKAVREFVDDPIWADLERAQAVIVCAAGNSGTDLDTQPAYPACIDRPNILCVGAIGPDGKIATWDSAASCTGARSVDVLAPGSLIAVSDGGGSFSIVSGTSYACAFASGIAALHIAANPDIGGADVVKAIVDAARQRPVVSGASRSGLLKIPFAAR